MSNNYNEQSPILQLGFCDFQMKILIKSSLEKQMSRFSNSEQL